MKIIIRLDTDDEKKIEHFANKVDEAKEVFILPQGDYVKVHVISDDGKVTNLR